MTFTEKRSLRFTYDLVVVRTAQITVCLMTLGRQRLGNVELTHSIIDAGIPHKPHGFQRDLCRIHVGSASNGLQDKDMLKGDLQRQLSLIVDLPTSPACSLENAEESMHYYQRNVLLPTEF